MSSNLDIGRHGTKRCAFTGHRPQKFVFGFNEEDPRCIDFKVRLSASIESLINDGYSYFLSGGALGMDMFAAEAVLDLKKEYLWIKLEMVSPFDGQARIWSPEYQTRHKRLFESADVVTAMSHAYTKGCLFKRNRYLVDNADLLLAAFDEQPGGTAMTVAYAKRKGIPVSVISP